MSRQVLFNGAVLTRPGAYTKVDASQFNNIALLGIGVVGLIGDADGGEPRVTKVFNAADAVKAEYRSGDLVEAAAILADPGNDERIPAGASAIVCYKTNLSTVSTLAHATAFTFNSLDWGLHTTSIQVAITSSAGLLRVVQVTGLDSFGNLITETSPEFGDPTLYGKFTIQYVGAGSACTMTITATTLTTTVTGGPGGENLAITFANYASLAEMLFYIDGLAAYTATALITNSASFDPANLDALVAADIRTSLVTVMANNFDLADWLNSNSSLIECDLTQGQTGPRVVLTKTALAGGTRGTSDNTAWANAFTALSGIRVNQLVTLASENAAAAQGTYTIASINAALESHCKLMTATAGKSERQGWGSIEATKTNLIAAAQALNSEHVQMCSQKITRTSGVSGNQVEFPEWALACCFAGMRAGAPIGEPLTHKVIKAAAISNDSSWSTEDTNDIIDLLLNGIMFVTSVQGVGFRIEKGITTYTKSNNDAFVEESIVQNWKYISYSWRTELEKRYTGRPMDVGQVQTVKPFSAVILNELRLQGAITDSIVDGVQTPGYKNIRVTATNDILRVSGEVSPTSGINFILNTAVLVPAQFSL
jgi:phage tail sheath gpL-like